MPKIVDKVREFIAEQLISLYRFRVVRPVRFFVVCAVTTSLLLGMAHFYPAAPSQPFFNSISEFVVVALFFAVSMHFLFRFGLWLS